MDLLRWLPIRFRLLGANLAIVAVMTAGTYRLIPAGDTAVYGLIVLVGMLVAAVFALSISRSVTIPLAALKRKLKEIQETDKDHVIRDRASDEIGDLYRAVNDYVLYRDNDTVQRRAGAGAVTETPRPPELSPHGAQELDHLGLLAEFGKLLSLNYDFGDAAHQVLVRVNAALNLEWSSVIVWDEAAKGMRLAASEGLDPKLSLDVRAGERPAVQFKPGEGISGEVFATGQPLIINKGSKDKRFKQFPKFTYSTKRINTLACIPLTSDGVVLGVANFINVRSAAVFTEEHVAFLARIAEVLAFLLVKSSNFDSAFRESVSGLWTPDYFQHVLMLESERIRRKPHPLALVKVSVDFVDRSVDQAFRNQTYAKIGDLVRRTYRRIDRATRTGGDFLIALPGTDGLGALFTAGRLKEQIDAISYDARDRQLFATCGGVASFPEPVAELANLPAAVDQALAEARRIGDSRVVCFRPDLGAARDPEAAPEVTAGA